MVNTLNQGTFFGTYIELKKSDIYNTIFSKKRSQLNIYYRALLFLGMFILNKQSYSQTTTHYVSVYSHRVFSSKEEEEYNINIHE